MAKDFGFKQREHNKHDPDPWLALYLDKSLPMSESAKAALLKGNGSFSRRIMLPIFRPLARLSIILVQLIRMVLPSRIQSSKLLHRTIYWGLKYFVSPEANYLILRHFNIGTEMLQFIGANTGVDINTTTPLKPKSLEDLLDDTFLIHDLNIYNFIIELNTKLQAQGRDIEPPAAYDFSMLSNEPIDFESLPNKWHNFIDIQTAIELYTPMYGLCLSDHDFWRASNSLQLDETIAIYVSKLMDTPLPLSLVSNRHPTVPIITLAAGYRLMLHGLDAENLYGFLQQQKTMRQTLKTA
jgi:hypothetical protein